MHVNSPRITKSLGACSPRETHTKEPTSAHKILVMYCLWVCLSVQTQVSRITQASRHPLQGADTPPGNQHPLQGADAPPGDQHPLQGRKCPARAKSKTLGYVPSRWFLPLKSLFSLLCLMGCLHVKGEPQASRLAGSYFSKPHTPPGLVEP